MALNPYLYFDGQCEEAFRFYEKCLGGKITFMMTWEGSPMPGQAPQEDLARRARLRRRRIRGL
jgi:PhnB protein